VTAKPKVATSASGHLKSQTVHGGQLPPDPTYRGSQRFRGRFKAIEQQPTRPAQVSFRERFHKRRRRSNAAGGRPAGPVDVGGRQPDRRANDDEVQVAQSGHHFDPLSATSADGWSRDEKQRHIATQFGAQLLELDS
jgi:hypothetical protein